jgi:protein-histidine pros-kinase
MDGAGAPVVDWEAARRNIPGGDEGVRKLAAVMVDECARLLDELRNALADGDPARVRLAAHTLKGGARHFAAEEVIVAASGMEALGAAGDLAGAREAWPRLEAAVQRLVTALADA